MTNPTISFFVPMKPEAKQGDRSRIVKCKNGTEFVGHYKDKKVEQAENWIAMNAMKHAPAIPLDGPLFAILKAYTIPPDSYSGKKKNACLSMDMWPTGRPDIDNLCKMVFDALGYSKVFFTNDSRFVFAIIIKQYSQREGIEFTFGDIENVVPEIAKIFTTYYEKYNSKQGEGIEI